jgi:RNA polymerase sigma factor (sigma-70 family)
MESGGSVTRWMMQLHDADPAIRGEAARVLWERYRPWLLGIARRRFDPMGRGRGEDEDVALDAFHSVCVRQQGEASTLHDRAHLERTLRLIVARKICTAIRRQYAGCRDIRRERGGDVPGDAGSSAGVALSDRVEASPSEEELGVAMNEALEPIQLALPDAELQVIVRWILEDFTLAEIAEKLGCTARTVRRRYQRIRRQLEPLRRQWEGESP